MLHVKYISIKKGEKKGNRLKYHGAYKLGKFVSYL